MSAPLSPHQLKAHLVDGLMGFPVTDFSADGALLPDPFQARVADMAQRGCAALFVAAGAGEFFSLTTEEYARLLSAATAAKTQGVPLLGAAGMGTRDAVAQARLVEKSGADGLLVLPPYLTEVTQAGLAAHITEICRSTALGVVVYSRANGRLKADTLARLAEQCPNLVALKDGVGDTEELWAMRLELGDRVAFLNGMPTAEVYAPAFAAMGVPSYSSAIFSFLPGFALSFFRAVQRGDQRFVADAMARFVLPYVRLRMRQPGYAVSVPKAGVSIVGRSAGPVRAPLTDISREEYAALEQLIAAARQLEKAASVAG
jgi:5-dehydro-4-deoxyglucarate dehydratase